MEEENKVEEVVNEPVEERKGLSIAAMVLGIVSVALFCVWYIALPCGILAIVFGIIGGKRGAKKMAKAGLILGIVSIALFIFLIILVAIGIMGSTASILSSV